MESRGNRNEAGYEKERGTVEGRENSLLYNEKVLLRACMRAKVASSSVREECVQAHAVSGELGPNDEVHHNEPCSNGVSKDESDKSAVLPEGKPSNVEPQGACQGAMTSEKNVPDYPLLSLSRGF